jgi:hypothetical protein
VALVRATILLLVARLALLLLPFPRVFRFVDRGRRSGRRLTGREPGSPADGEDLATLIWAVDVMGSRLFPDSPCLTQAVVVHRLLRKEGRPSEFRIGVRKDGQRKFGAHAWIESDGEVLIGGDALSEGFVPMPPVSEREAED